MKRRWSNRDIKNKLQMTLFTKIILVTLCGILAATVLVTMVTLRTGEALYMSTFSTNNQKIGDRIVDEMENLDYKADYLMEEYARSSKLKKFSTEYISTYDRFDRRYQLQNELFLINAEYGLPIFNIFTIGINGNYYTDNYIGVTSRTSKDIMEMDIYKRYKRNTSTTYHYMSSGLNGYAVGNPSIVITKGLRRTVDNTIYCDMFISIKEDEFSQLYEKYLVRGNEVILLSKYGQVLSSSLKGYIGQQNETILRDVKDAIKESKDLQATLDDKNYLFTARYIWDLDFYLVILTDTGAVARAYSKSSSYIVLFAVITALLTTLVILIITRRTTSPLTRLVGTMEMATEAHFKEKVPIEGGFEVRKLSEAYNQMVMELESYINRLMEEQEQRRMAELSALQMQINPHFLYNTLASIKYLAWQGDNQAVDKMINAFIALLQNTISKTDEMVSVREEVDNLKNYAMINSMRYGEKIQVAYYVDDGALDLMLPKLILQPIVENAFFHAFSNKGKGRINIFVSYINQRLTCEVIDNGDGMKEFEEKERTNFKTYSKGIGLDNIRQRLNLIYDEKAQLSIESTPHIGTSVKIVITTHK